MTVAELVAASRARQGLPPRVIDSGAVRRLAALLQARKDAAPIQPGAASETGGQSSARTAA